MFPTSRPDSLHSGDSLLTESHVSWRAGPWPRCNSQTIPSLDVHHFTQARGTTTDKLFFTFWTYNNVLSISNQHGSESAASTPDTTDKGHISNLWLIPVALETSLQNTSAPTLALSREHICPICPSGARGRSHMQMMQPLKPLFPTAALFLN